MSSNFQRPNQSDRARGQVWDILTNFSYSPSSLESWCRLAAQITIAGLAITTFKALDGDVCGQGWSVWLPQTWGIPSGCFVRSLVKNVPDSFLDRPAQSPRDENVLEPIRMGQPEQPATRTNDRRGG
jgi:hypothetical protein